MSEEKFIDWAAIEKDYRAGLKTLRTIADEHGITEGAIRKRAKRDIWTRSLDEKIKQRAEEKVRKELVRKPSTQLAPETEKRTVEEYSDVVASVDLIQRDDVKVAMDTARGLLNELALMCDPKFRDALEWLVALHDESGPTPNGGWKNDKTAELYRYIVSHPGRVKAAKEIAATHGVYIPIQRKMYKLDADENKAGGSIDDVLSRIRNAE